MLPVTLIGAQCILIKPSFSLSGGNFEDSMASQYPWSQTSWKLPVIRSSTDNKTFLTQETLGYTNPTVWIMIILNYCVQQMWVVASSVAYTDYSLLTWLNQNDFHNPYDLVSLSKTLVGPWEEKISARATIQYKDVVLPV